MHQTMIVLTLVILAFCQHALTAAVPYARPLSQPQIERLKNWTEDDKQNIWELSGQYEGDMILVPGQRNGLIQESYRWKNNIIPYELDSVFTQEEADWIQTALDAYAENSCVTVRRKIDGDADYVYVTGDDSGCWSYVGRFGGKQTLNLARGTLGSGCFRNGTIIHEFLHAAGFYHQQSTHDRDDYVEIIWENISSGSSHNFDKYSSSVVTNFDETYDYGSVMHYSAYAFSANGEKTIVVLQDTDAEVGQRVGMSEIDIRKLNKMYCES